MTLLPIDTSFLNPTCAAFINSLPSVEESEKITMEMRRAGNNVTFLSDTITRPDVFIERIEISDQNDGHAIPVDVYRPKHMPSDSILPVVVYTHGGGFFMSAEDGHTYLASKLADEVKCVVLSVDYSLSPEVKFPVALEESYSVVSYVSSSETAAKLNVDPTRVAVGGDSAGGNLATAITLLAKKKNNLQNPIKYQFLYYPVVDNTMNSKSYQEFGDGGYVLSKSFVNSVNGWYVADDLKDDILVCPGKATVDEVRDLPPALLITCDVDVLRDEGEDYGRKLLMANVPVTSIRVNGVVHGFMSIPALHCEETLNVIETTISILKRTFYN